MLGIQWYNNITIGEPYHLLEEQNGEWWCGLDSIMWDCEVVWVQDLTTIMYIKSKVKMTTVCKCDAI
jgi:hypothetical protein